MMEGSPNLPTALQESKVAESDDQPEPIGTDVEKDPSQTIVQRAEDNPRAVELMDPRVESDTSTAPATQAQQIPQLPQRTFADSQWARRNARIKAIRLFFPRKVAKFLCGACFFFLFLLIVAQAGVLVVGPAVLAMVVGATVCKASNLPHLPLITAAHFGAAGGFFAGLVCIPFLFVVLFSSISLNKRYREQGIRSGRLPRSCRQSGHFPDILLFVPVVFLNCLLGGIIGKTYARGPDVTATQGLSRRELAQMATIGGLIVAPIFPIVFFFLFGVIEVAWLAVSEISQGYPSYSSLEILPYLWRQFVAFRRLMEHITGWYRTPSPPMAAV